MTTCPKCIHIKEGCNASCHFCEYCHVKYDGADICDKICRHSVHVDDGGFLIDGNHPDDMYSLGELNNVK